MPLIHDASEESFHANVKTLIEEGKPQDQALAIAYSIRKDAGWKDDKEPRGIVKAHVKGHYRYVNGKSVYVHEHDKAGAPVGTEANLQQRTQVAKHVKTGALHLRAFDAEDRDKILEHANKLGIKTEVKRQAGHLHYHEGGKGDHAFYQIHAGSDEDAMKLHAALGGNKKVEADKASDAAGDASDAASDASTMAEHHAGDAPKPGAHLKAVEAHSKAHAAHEEAMKLNEEAGNAQMAEYHGNKMEQHKVGMKYHEQESKKAETKEDYDKKSGLASKLSEYANADSSYGNHVAASEAHGEAEKAAKAHFGEDSEEAKHHLELNIHHGEKANAEHEKLMGKAPEPPKKPEAPDYAQVYKENAEGAAKKGKAADAASKAYKKPEKPTDYADEHLHLAKQHEDALSDHYMAEKVAPDAEKKAMHAKKGEHHQSMVDLHKYAHAQSNKEIAKHYAGEALDATREAIDNPSQESHKAAAEAHEQAMNTHEWAHKSYKELKSYHDLGKAANKDVKNQMEFHEQGYGWHGEAGLYHHAAANAYEASKEAHASGTKEHHEKAIAWHQTAMKEAGKASPTYESKLKGQHSDKIAEHMKALDQGTGAKTPDEAKGNDEYAHLAGAANDASAKAGVSGQSEHHIQAIEAHQKAMAKGKEIGLAAEHIKGHEQNIHAHAKGMLESSIKEVEHLPRHEQHDSYHRSLADIHEKEGNYAKAAEHQKHAAIIAHHRGMKAADEGTKGVYHGLAAESAQKAKELEAKAKENPPKEVKKAVDTTALKNGVIEAARALYQQSHQRKFMAKALADLPAVGGLRDACLKATQAGITDMPSLIAMALGGKAQAAPFVDTLKL